MTPNSGKRVYLRCYDAFLSGPSRIEPAKSVDEIVRLFRVMPVASSSSNPLMHLLHIPSVRLVSHEGLTKVFADTLIPTRSCDRQS